MSTTVPTRTATTREGSPLLLPPPVHWHRPLIALAVGMVAVGLVATVGLIVDQRELVGAPVWAKPLKFAISIAIYAVTWAWLIGQLQLASIST